MIALIFFYVVGGICKMNFFLSESTEIPYLEITCPNNIPSKTTKTVFLGFKEIPYFLHLSNIYFRWFRWYSLFFE